MYYVYLLQSLKCDRFYIGCTVSVEKRLALHNCGRVFSTKPYRPWQIIHVEAYRNQNDALRRERYLKTSQGARLLKRMLKDYFYFQKNL